ncbi:ABC-type transport system [Candidatus Scalindua japonica]|uniref:ABC-type transport system n=1 Tax=Candidatus Scalindua japonica TaxID=1284222 RepID=A0A286TVR4_9BACT|nr:hypothetical protein [Candidatus Scalindua japonica]GAX59931.1 ABC-type transport system [Candidatus Scalindua japonica]
MFSDIPGITFAGYTVKTGMAAAVMGLILNGTGLNTSGSEIVHYPGYYGQQKRLKINGEWQVRLELEKSRLAEGKVRPDNIYIDAKKEYKLIGSLKRYDWEPTNEIFFKTYKKVINRLCEAHRCYEILTEFNKKNSHITYEIWYHPYYVDLTYFMCGKAVHQIHVARTFKETSEKSLIGTMYHELIAHGSQVMELTNNGKRSGVGRTRIMKQWERELEGHLVKWYAENEMYGIKEIKNVHREMKKWLSVFPEWNYFRIKEIERLEVKDVIMHLLTHYQKKYRNEDWVKTTYLHKLVS